MTQTYGIVEAILAWFLARPVPTTIVSIINRLYVAGCEILRTNRAGGFRGWLAGLDGVWQA
jgi:hypothetical protein